MSSYRSIRNNSVLVKHLQKVCTFTNSLCCVVYTATLSNLTKFSIRSIEFETSVKEAYLLAVPGTLFLTFLKVTWPGMKLLTISFEMPHDFTVGSFHYTVIILLMCPCWVKTKIGKEFILVNVHIHVSSQKHFTLSNDTFNKIYFEM